MILLLAFLMPAFAYAQQPPAGIQSVPDHERILSLLQSSDPKDQAWGAWFAGQSKFREGIPLLEKVVKQHVNGKGWDITDFSRHNEDRNTDAPPMDAALDALIQLDAKVSPDLISAIYKKRYVQAFVLLSKLDHEGDSFLLDLASRERGRAWYAAANLLLAHRAPGTASLLLHNLEIWAAIVVFDKVSDIRGTGFGEGFSIAEGPGPRFGQPPGYPPLAHYTLNYRAEADSIALAPGPVAVYYKRGLAAGLSLPDPSHPQGNDGPGKEGVPRSDDRLQYIAALGHFEGKMPVPAKEQRVMVLRGKATLESEINNYKKDLLNRYAKLVKMLKKARLLTEEEASVLPGPEIKIIVSDHRSPKKP
jgi:hypothetical protein